MAEAVRELLVFLASPGDVEAERGAVREVANRVNANFEDRGVRVRVVGWEQVRPEFGRPQELINPLVYKCDVFIGLLNRRWGSGTGEFSSGFEEEFEAALERRRAGVTPAMGMFFADLPADVLADPGAQLQAVLSFRDRVRTERIALYKQYGSTDNLATEVLDFLTGHVLELADQIGRGGSGDGEAAPTGSIGLGSRGDQPVATSSGAQPEEDASPADGTDNGDTEDSRAEVNSAAAQIADALRGFAEVFDDTERDWSEADRDRVTLVGTAFAVDDKLLGTHHVNRLYRRRDELDLTVGEARTWFRTYFADRGADRAGRTVPVWGVFHPSIEKLDDLDDDLVRMAANDDVRVSRGAVAFLTEHAVRPAGLWPNAPGSGAAVEVNDGERDGQQGESADGRDGSGSTGAGVDEGQEKVDVALRFWEHLYSQMSGVGLAANYMSVVATEADLHFLDALALDGDLDASSKDVVQAVAAWVRGDPKPMVLLAPSRYVEGVDDLVERLLAVVDGVGEPEWESLLDSRNPKLAGRAAVQLIGVGRVEKSDLLGYLKLNNREVDAALVDNARRSANLAAALVTSLRENKGLEHAEERIAGVLAAVTTPEDLRSLETGESYRSTVWIAQTMQDPAGMLEQARAVLDDRADFLDHRVAPLVGEYESLAKHIVADHKRAACVLLANVASEALGEDRSADLDRAIAELVRDDFLTRDAALEAVAALVEESTVDRVPVSVIDGYGVTSHVGMLLAGPLAPSLAALWSSSSVSELQRAAAIWHVRQPDRTDEELEELTYDDDQYVRMAAVDVILGKWSREQVSELLGRYDQQQRQYWYNVIAAMDDHLYGFAD